MARSEVFDSALARSAADRGKLAEGDLEPDRETAWVAEIERRLARLASGQSKMLSMDDAVARLGRAARGS